MAAKVSTRFLIADDNPSVRRILRKILEDHSNWLVTAEAADGIEAVAHALDSRPDVMILDMVMPRMNGISAAEEIRRLLPSTLILICTMLNKEFLEPCATAAGVRAVIQKADLGDRLIPAIEALLSGAAYPSLLADKQSPRRLSAHRAGSKA